MQALQEALKYVQKSQRVGKQALLQSLARRSAAISAFLQAQQLFGSDAASAVQMCNGLIVEVNRNSNALLPANQGHLLVVCPAFAALKFAKALSLAILDHARA